jgi:hypothetical protein
MSTHNANSNRKPVNRTMVGLISLGCMISGGYLWAQQPEDKKTMMWAAGLIRAGALMAAFWIALPTKDRPAAWAQVSKGKLAGIILAIGAMAFRPWIFVPMFAVLMAVSFLLRPGRDRHRPNRDSWNK